MPRKKIPTHEKLYPNGRINKETGCLEWQRWRDKDGYGWLRVDGKNHRVHRLAYADRHGEIPEGMLVLHLCNNPACFNADHLTIGTQADNMKYKATTGRQLYGQATYNSSLTNDQAIEIAQMIRSGMKNIPIAEIMGVDRSLIQRIRQGQTWSEITGIPKWQGPSRSNINAEIALEVVRLNREGVRNKDIAAALDLSTVLVSNLLTGYAWGSVTGIEYKPIPRVKK